MVAPVPQHLMHSALGDKQPLIVVVVVVVVVVVAAAVVVTAV